MLDAALSPVLPLLLWLELDFPELPCDFWAAVELDFAWAAELDFAWAAEALVLCFLACRRSRALSYGELRSMTDASATIAKLTRASTTFLTSILIGLEWYIRVQRV